MRRHMKIKRTAFYLSLIAFLSSSCVKIIPFTQSLKDNENLTESAIHQLQFYISGEVLLEREVHSRNSMVSQSHRLIIRNGKKIEQIRINHMTPCLIGRVQDRIVYAQFEKENNYLAFGATQKDKYYLLARGWDASGVGAVEYGGKIFKAHKKSGSAFLLIELKQFKKRKKKVKTLPGLRFRDLKKSDLPILFPFMRTNHKQNKTRSSINASK
jgi:hypothetical protein